MNKEHNLYSRYLGISNDWPLDDWSITKECFDNIVNIIPFEKTILEIGSGHSTRLLSEFYNMISIESSHQWMNKYKSDYKYIPLKEMNSEVFGLTQWLDIDILKETLKEINYELLIVDAGGDRIGIYDNIELFNTNVPIIFDDTMNEAYLKCATLTAQKINKDISTITCAQNKFCVTWWDGKKYSIIS
jgi:hypothetical protein